MKANVLDVNGRKLKEIDLPKCFSHPVRKDLIAKVLEVKKTKQPYGPSPIAGKQHAAKGKIVHRRHVWKSGYGRGNSRVPRKIFSRRGTQFNWEAAEVPFARGGMRAHPPKPVSMINIKKINKKEINFALCSALSATADKKEIKKKYTSLKDEKIENLPLVVEGKLISLKTKDFLISLKKILGKELFSLALKKRKIRSGRGKMRGRKYKTNAGLLIVTGKKEETKSNITDNVNIGKLSILDLTNGKPGRLTLYTEQAIKDLGEKFKGK